MSKANAPPTSPSIKFRPRSLLKTAAMIVVFLAAVFQALRAFAGPLSNDPYDVPNTLSDLLAQTQQQNGSLYTYPTDITRNIMPVCLTPAYFWPWYDM